MHEITSQTRRRLIAGSAAAIALNPLFSRAQGFPSKNMRVVIPTGQGGGADRLARVFDDFWGPLLKANFEYGFSPARPGRSATSSTSTSASATATTCCSATWGRR